MVGNEQLEIVNRSSGTPIRCDIQTIYLQNSAVTQFFDARFLKSRILRHAGICRTQS